MVCLRCRHRVRYVFSMCWHACACRVWITDEQIARELN